MFRQTLKMYGQKTTWAITATKKNAGIRRRHLQKRSLPRKKFIFALQMSKKHCIIVSNISVRNGFKIRTSFSCIPL